MGMIQFGANVASLSRRNFLTAAASIGIAFSLCRDAAGDKPSSSEAGVVLEGIEELYDARYTSCESGYRRLSSGHLLISAQHRMLKCRGEMVEWWLRRSLSPEEFKRWHPIDHISIETISESSTNNPFGKSSHVKQTVGGQTRETIMEGRDPSDYFSDLARLRASGVTAVICNRGRLSTVPAWTTRIIHVCRDLDWGCEMRSRFWLGPMAPVNDVPLASVLEKQLPDGAAAGLLKHTLEEYTYLASFLPEYYASNITR